MISGHISLFGSFYSGPCLLAERAGILFLSGPATDAMSVVSVVAGSPGNRTALSVCNLVCLALQTGLVDTVLADGTVLYSDVP